MPDPPPRRLAVVGDPIEHSRSPELHAAAAGVLGVPWQYGRVRLGVEDLPAFLDGLGPDWAGLSATMPLKETVLALADEADEVARVAGGANTVRFDPDGVRRVWNTDVGGIERALAERGVDVRGATALILGAGATARSALVALARAGASRVVVSGRTPERVEAVATFGAALGLSARTMGADVDVWPEGTRLVVSTLPGGADPRLPAPLPALGLLDAAYAGSPLVRRWRREAPDAPVVQGVDMLVHQAVLQVRVFTGGDSVTPVAGEAAVLRAMRAAVGGS